MADLSQYEIELPDTQQEDEEDLNDVISFKDAVVMNADWTIETINGQINKGNIDLQPSFQRRGAWDDTRKSRLIESIIVGMPVPNIVLAEQKDHRGRFIVIDGKQRLLTINEFLQNGYTLKGLDIRADLNGCMYNNLPMEDREYLDNSTLRSTVIRSWQDESFLYAIFYRLNSGSLALSPQELRKALIGGKLLDKIDEYITQSKDIKLLFGNKLDRRMRDSELVLRYIAFERDLQSYKGNFKEFLDDTVGFYEDNWNTHESVVDNSLDKLNLSLKTSFDIFGKDAFKKWLGTKYERVMNRAIFDAVARFFGDSKVSQAALNNPQKVVDAFHALCSEKDFLDTVEKTTKTVGATNGRIDAWGRALSSTIGMTYDSHNQRII